MSDIKTKKNVIPVDKGAHEPPGGGNRPPRGKYYYYREFGKRKCIYTIKGTKYHPGYKPALDPWGREIKTVNTKKRLRMIERLKKRKDLKNG